MFLVLHGKTEWNAAGRLQGHGDSGLTEPGRQQSLLCAEIIARYPASCETTSIVASPLGRSHATAMVLAQRLGLPTAAIRHDPRLAEVRLGCWEGLTRSKIEAGWPEEMNRTGPDDWYFASPDGERYEGVAYRLRSWLEDLADHDDLIVVSHGVASRVLCGLYLGLPKAKALELRLRPDAVFHLVGHRIEELGAP